MGQRPAGTIDFLGAVRRVDAGFASAQGSESTVAERAARGAATACACTDSACRVPVTERAALSRA